MISKFYPNIFLWLILSITTLLGVPEPASGQSFASETWQFLPNFSGIGASNLVVSDIDRDGKDEVVFASEAPGFGVIKILDENAGNYDQGSYSVLLDGPVRWMQAWQTDPFTPGMLFAVQDDGTMLVFDLNGLKQVDSFAVPVGIKKFFLVDQNADQLPEIVVLLNTEVQVLNHQGAVLHSKTLNYLYDMAVGDVDGNADLEVVVSGQDGYVLKLSDLSQKWQYFGGFGSILELKDISGNGKSLIFGVRFNNSITCYDAVNQSPLWQLGTSYSITSLKVADLNSDGNYEMLAGQDISWQGIVCYSISNRNLLWEMQTPGNGVNAMVLTDLDNDGATELVYGSGSYVGGQNALVVARWQTQENIWQSPDLSGSFSIDVADINGDDVQDVILASKFTESGSRGGACLLVDGLSRQLIGKIRMPLPYSSIVDIAFGRVDGKPCLAFFYEYQLVLYDVETENVVLEKPLDGRTVMLGSWVRQENGQFGPMLIGYLDGSMDVFSFQDNQLDLSWSTVPTGSPVLYFETGNYDTDSALELAFLSGNILWIYDMGTRLLQRQVSLANTAAQTFTLKDWDADGKVDLLFQQEYANLGILNLTTGTRQLFPISGGQVKAMRVENLDMDPSLEIVLLLEEKMEIYKTTGRVFESQKLSEPSFFRNDFMEVADMDGDRRMQILLGTQIGVFEFEIDTEFLDIELPRIRRHFPKAGAFLVPTNAPLEVVFSESMQGGSLDSFINITDQAGQPLAFSGTADASGKIFILQPTTTWTASNTILVKVLPGLRDLAGNPLDGNANGIADGPSDAFQWSFQTGAGVDTFGPGITLDPQPASFYRGVPVTFSGRASDLSATAISAIARVEFFLDEPANPGSGTPAVATDGLFESDEEAFWVKLSTSNLSFGPHVFQVVAMDALGNWGNPASFQFNILEEDPADWAQYSKDDFNTGFNPQSELTLPLKERESWRYGNGLDNLEINRSITVGTRLVYTIRNRFGGANQLVCRDIQTGELLWEQIFGLSDGIYGVSSAYGLLYVQLGDHAQSKLACFDLTTGARRWITPYSVQWMEAYSPKIYDGKVYIVEGDYSTTLGAYDAFTGQVLWKRDINQDNFDKWTPVVFNDTLYVYARDLAAINPDNGDIYWKKDENAIPFTWNGWTLNSIPIVDTANRQLILENPSFIHAFSLDRRTLNWSIPNFGNWQPSPALLAGEHLYLVQGNRLMQVSARTGAITWEYTLSTDLFDDLQPVANQHFLAASTNEKTYIFDLADYNLYMTLDTWGELTLSRDYLFVSSSDGALTMYELDSGLAGTIQVSNPISCFGAQDGALRANVTGGAGNYTFQWSVPGGADTQEVVGLEAGIYRVTIVDMDGSRIVLTKELTQPTMLAISGVQVPSTDGQPNGKITVQVSGGTPPYEYTWPGFPDEDGSALEGLVAGVYEVIVADQNGCTENLWIRVDQLTHLGPGLEKNPIRIYPAITRDEVRVNSQFPLEDCQIQVFDWTGKQVGRQFFQDGRNAVISLGHLQSGMYILRLDYRGGRAIQKIVVNP